MATADFLVDYLAQFGNLSDEAIKVIENESFIREFAKGDVLLEEGQVAKECFVVLKGCVKRYYLDDGMERIMDFYTENDPINPVSYVTQKPSEYFLDCVEPCIISTGNQEKTQEVLQKYPWMLSIFIKIGDQLAAKEQVSMDEFKNLPPETRYEKLVENRPSLINRVPQYMIASYLGIQPESLSRIRKRIQTTKR